MDERVARKERIKAGMKNPDLSGFLVDGLGAVCSTENLKQVFDSFIKSDMSIDAVFNWKTDCLYEAMGITHSHSFIPLTSEQDYLFAEDLFISGDGKMFTRKSF